MTTGMSHEEFFKIYCEEGPVGLERLKQEGEIIDYTQDEGGRYSIQLIGHIEKFEVTMSVGVYEDII